MNDDKLIPEIRFKGFTEAWEQRKLTDEVTLYNGLTYNPTNIVKANGTLVLRSSNVQNGELSLNDNIYVLNDVVNCNNVEVGDIIVVVRNGSRSLIGKHAQIKVKMPNTVIGAFMTGIKSNQYEFINSLLNTPKFDKKIQINMGATINQITNGAFNNMSFYFPTDKEKTKIGVLFNELDRLITLHQHKHDKLVNIKKSMLEKMFPKNGAKIPETRFKKFDDVWEHLKLKQFCSYSTSSITASDVDENGKYNLYDAKGVIGKTNNNIQKSKYISIIKDGSGVGRVRILPENSSFIGTMGALHNENSDLAFLYAQLERTNFTKQITGATIPHIYFSQYGELEYCIPILSEQAKIGAFFWNVDNLVALHQRKIDKLKDIKESLLTKMFV